MLVPESGGGAGPCGRIGPTRIGGNRGVAPTLSQDIDFSTAFLVADNNARRPCSDLLRPKSGTRLGDAGGRLALKRFGT
jgi:hypothetical protein